MNRRYLFWILAMLLPLSEATATASLSIESFSISGGETKEMVIDLNNPATDITLVQFDLRLPAGLTLKQTDGEYNIDIAGRTTWRKHSLDANTQADGSIRFLLASSSNTVLSGSSGAIISITLVASSSFNHGDIKLENILMVSPDEKETTQPTYTYTIGNTPPAPVGTATLSIEDLTIEKGGEAEMVIDLTNPDDAITLVQFDLRLPAGLSLKQVGGEYDFDIAGRTTWRKHSLDANAQADGSIRFLLASSSNTVLSGTEGAIIKMTLVADNGFTSGTVRMQNILLVTPDEKEITPSNLMMEIEAKDNTSEQGDVNGDKVVDEADVEDVVSLILNRGDTSKLNRKVADINEDNIIDVVDVAGVVNLILGFDVSPHTDVVTQASKPLLYFNACPIGVYQTITLPIILDSNGDSFTGCQFDLGLKWGLEVAEKDGIPQVESTTKNHVVSASCQPDGTLRVVCYSNNNSDFRNEEILTIAIHATEDTPLRNIPVTLRNITLSRSDVTGKTLNDFDNELIVVGISEVVCNQDGAHPVYTVSGQRLTAPRKGLNIVGGKKIIVK